MANLQTRTQEKKTGKIRNPKGASAVAKTKKGDTHIKKKEEERPPTLTKRRWNPPETIDIVKEAWEKPGSRVAYFSMGGYRKKGWRRGLLKLAAQIAAEEGCHFPVFAGGIISKEWFQEEVKRLSRGVPRKFVPQIVEHMKHEVIEALNATIPMFKKPDGSFTRWYMMASLPYDGPEGEDVIHRLQDVRPDIRLYQTGGEKIEVRQDGKPSIYHGVVLPKRKRLSSSYMSARPEADIRDIENQTNREPLPNAWVYANSATALFKPKGEREIPYVTLPDIRKIEAEDQRIAENQVGLTILEDLPDGDFLVHWWNLRDLILHERQFITGVKEGATELHKKILELLKKEGARHPGRIADDLNIERGLLTKEIQFLVEPGRLSRRSRPGLYYDQASDRYDFHEDWIQESLRYEMPKHAHEWSMNSFFFFGCLHAGYTTTDYEFVVKKFPEIILKYDIRVLGGIGDFIAGLRHNLMAKGQILNMNNTEQEEFSAELLATVIYKVFVRRFEDGLARFGFDRRTPSAEELGNLFDTSLLTFLIKKGNHDTWQEQEGNTALTVFYYILISLLLYHIHLFLMKKNVSVPQSHELIKKKIVMVSEDQPVYLLPSGIKVGLIHPYMARAQTSSLRAEQALKMFPDCQVVGVANFHTAFLLHKWNPTIGQRVAIQTGTEAIFTHFEKSLMKTVDFGPLFLRTLSHNGRIYKTTAAAFSTPLLQNAIPKDTNIRILKQELQLLGY